MKVDLFEAVSECGCAAKVPAQELAGMLRGIDIPTSPAVLVGPETLDDAGIYKLDPDRCLVQTVDFFPPVARDPEEYGKIAAANSLSDIYAMGGSPITALAMVCFPSKLIAQGALAAVIKGAAGKLKEANCVLLGGHSVLDTQAKFGLAVTGLVNPEKMFTNAAARPGDVLFLTKPLGTGVTVMAARAGMAAAGHEAGANMVMSELNRKAAEIAAEFGVKCATDITGFGLLGHAMQMARTSGVALELGFEGIPVLEGALEYSAQGMLSAAAYSNRSYVGENVKFEGKIPLNVQDLLFDPQTSGGMLICCPEGRAAEFIARARKTIKTPCGVIGRVVKKPGKALMGVGMEAVSI